MIRHSSHRRTHGQGRVVVQRRARLCVFFMFMLCMFTVYCDYRFSLVAAKRACIYPNVGFQLQLCLLRNLDKDFDEVLYTGRLYILWSHIGRRRRVQGRLPRRSGARRVHQENFGQCRGTWMACSTRHALCEDSGAVGGFWLLHPELPRVPGARGHWVALVAARSGRTIARGNWATSTRFLKGPAWRRRARWPRAGRLARPPERHGRVGERGSKDGRGLDVGARPRDLGGGLVGGGGPWPADRCSSAAVSPAGMSRWRGARLAPSRR